MDRKLIEAFIKVGALTQALEETGGNPAEKAGPEGIDFLASVGVQMLQEHPELTDDKNIRPIMEEVFQAALDELRDIAEKGYTQQ